jgi:hypothetical protein
VRARRSHSSRCACAHAVSTASRSNPYDGVGRPSVTMRRRTQRTYSWPTTTRGCCVAAGSSSVRSFSSVLFSPERASLAAFSRRRSRTFLGVSLTRICLACFRRHFPRLSANSAALSGRRCAAAQSNRVGSVVPPGPTPARPPPIVPCRGTAGTFSNDRASDLMDSVSIYPPSIDVTNDRAPPERSLPTAPKHRNHPQTAARRMGLGMAGHSCAGGTRVVRPGGLPRRCMRLGPPLLLPRRCCRPDRTTTARLDNGWALAAVVGVRHQGGIKTAGTRQCATRHGQFKIGLQKHGEQSRCRALATGVGAGTRESMRG